MVKAVGKKRKHCVVKREIMGTGNKSFELLPLLLVKANILSKHGKQTLHLLTLVYTTSISRMKNPKQAKALPLKPVLLFGIIHTLLEEIY